MSNARLLAAVSLLAAVAACATAATTASSDGTVDVRAVMQQQVNPAMLGIWDVTNNAMDDEGGLDPAQLDPVKWQRIADQADALAASGHVMAQATMYRAAAADNLGVDEGAVSMPDVQRHLDGDPRLFAQMAGAFAAHSAKLAEAARNRDAVATGMLVAEMDGVCESCHARFWYPE